MICVYDVEMLVTELVQQIETCSFQIMLNITQYSMLIFQYDNIYKNKLSV